MKKTALLGILSVLVVEAAGCMMGPNYKRPTVSVPTGYRSAMPDQPAAAASLGNEKWWDVYQDPVLADLIHTALQQNYDVRIAASRVLEAQAQLGITRANQFPSASVGADIFSQQNRSEEHTSELQSQSNLVCRLLLEKKQTNAADSEEP